MAVTVTNGMITIYDAESLTGFSSIGQTSSNALQPNIKIEGSNSMEARISGTGILGWMFDVGVGTDLSNRFLYFWGFNNQLIETFTNGGVRIRVSTDITGAINYGEWVVSGSDILVGTNANFQNFVVHTSRTPFDATLGTTPVLTSIRSVGLLFNNLTSSGRISMWLDIARQGGTSNTNMIKGGTIVSPGKSSEIASNDKLTTNAFGNFQLVKGAYILNSKFEFGDTAAESHFIDSNVTWFFEEQLLPPAGTVIYDLNFVGSASFTNEFKLGSLVGSGITAVGVGGGTIARATSNTPRFSMTILDSNINVDFLGTNISGADKIRLEQANAQMISCTISDSDTISIRNGAIFRKCIVTDSSATGGAGAIDLGASDPATDTFRDIQIQNSVEYGILLTGNDGTTYNFRNITFQGNTTADVRVTATTGTITINVLEGGDTPTISSAGATVVVNNSVNLNVTVKDQSNLPIENAQVYIENASTKAILLNTLTDINGNATNTFSFTTDTAINVRIRKSPPSGQILPISAGVQFDSSGSSFVDITTPANNATVGDVHFFPSDAQQPGDIFYIGSNVVFDSIEFNLSQPGVFSASNFLRANFEYWNGSSWVGLEENAIAGTNLQAAILDDGGIFADVTAAANDATPGDVVLFTASPRANDAFYLGSANRFNTMEFDMNTVNDGSATLFIRYDYWTGSSWNFLHVDDTDVFSIGYFENSSGQQTFLQKFAILNDWAKTTVNGQGPFYYVRCINLFNGTFSHNLIANQIKLNSVNSTYVDNTNVLTNSGTNSLNFKAPSDWTQTTINSQGPFYYIRMVPHDSFASSVYLANNNPIGTQIKITTPIEKKYFPINTSGTITNTGFNLTSIMIEDMIAQ